MGKYRHISFYLALLLVILFGFQRLAPITFAELFHLKRSVFEDFHFWNIITYWLPFGNKGIDDIIMFLILVFAFIRIGPDMEEMWGRWNFILFILIVILSNFVVITLLGKYPYYGSYLDLMLLWAYGFAYPIEGVKLFWLVKVQIKLLATIYFIAILIKIIYSTLTFEYDYLLTTPLTEEERVLLFAKQLVILLSSFLAILLFAHKIYGKNKNPILNILKKIRKKY